MKIMTILGTRPEIIKLSPLIPLLDKNFKHVLVHTGQHYSYNMGKIFFEELKLRKPDYNLNIISGSHAYQVSKMMLRIEKIIEKEKPDIVLVQGDTNTTLAGALVASKLYVKLVHVESGLRSFNRKMPEEINRIIVDHVSDILIAPDQESYDCLMKEGILKDKVFLTGSIVFDACLRNKVLTKSSKIFEKLRLRRNNYILVTLHRAQNTDEIARLKSIVNALNRLSDSIDIVFPIHPRTAKAIKDNDLTLTKKIKLIEPQGYVDFLKLMSSARLIISDSGGIQEESLAFNKPCLIPREDSEWMGLVEAGKNFLVGSDSDKIVAKVKELSDDKKLNQIKAIHYPYETGIAERIVHILKSVKL